MGMTVPELVAAHKIIPIPCGWQTDGEKLTFTSALDINGVTVERLQFRGVAYRTRPDEAVTFQMEYAPARAKFKPIWRIEWRPISPHNNKNRGPAEYRLKQINGTHSHRFDLNWDNTTESLSSGNLRIAVPIIPEPPDFSSLLDFVGNEFRISNMKAVLEPAWERLLL